MKSHTVIIQYLISLTLILFVPVAQKATCRIKFWQIRNLSAWKKGPKIHGYVVFECSWLILVILRLRTKLNYLAPKRNPASYNTRETPTGEGNKPSAHVYVDCKILSKLDCPLRTLDSILF